MALQLGRFVQSPEVQRALLAEMWVYSAVKNTPLPKLFDLAHATAESDTPGQSAITLQQKHWVSRWIQTVLK